VDISISPVFLQSSSFEITYMAFANHFFLSRVPIVLIDRLSYECD
jgi:hypothetical protein